MCEYSLLIFMSPKIQCLDKNEYIGKVESILNDEAKFKLITESAFNFITRMEDKLARLLRNLLKTNKMCVEPIK